MSANSWHMQFPVSINGFLLFLGQWSGPLIPCTIVPLASWLASSLCCPFPLTSGWSTLFQMYHPSSMLPYTVPLSQECFSWATQVLSFLRHLSKLSSNTILHGTLPYPSLLALLPGVPFTYNNTLRISFSPYQTVIPVQWGICLLSYSVKSEDMVNASLSGIWVLHDLDSQ